MSDLQSNVAIANGKITGTLKYVDSGALATDWGPGNFMALKFTSTDSNIADIKVGLRPSEGSGLVSLDSDMDGVFKVTDKDAQKFVIKSIGADGKASYQTFDLSDLTCETE